MKLVQFYSSHDSDILAYTSERAMLVRDLGTHYACYWRLGNVLMTFKGLSEAMAYAIRELQ